MLPTILIHLAISSMIYVIMAVWIMVRLTLSKRDPRFIPDGMLRTIFDMPNILLKSYIPILNIYLLLNVNKMSDDIIERALK